MGRNNRYGSGADTFMDAEQLRDQTDALIEKNYRELGKSVAVKEDSDGQTSFMGFKIPKALAPPLNLAYSTFIVPLTTKGAQVIYDQTLKIAQKSGSPHAKEIASGVELATKMGVLLYKPISEFIFKNKKGLDNRAELYQEIREAIEGTPADYRNNEVIAAAYDRVHQKWTNDLKRMLPDLPVYGMQAVAAYSSHLDLEAKRNPTAALSTPAVTGAGATAAVDPLEAINQRVTEARAKGMDPALIDAMIERELGKGNASRTMEGGDNLSSGNLMNYAAPAGAQALSESLKAIVDEGQRKKGDDIIAWDMIKFLKTQMDEMPAGQSPDRIRINGIGKNANKRMSLKEYIVEVFQQNEVDQGRGRMGEALVAQIMPAVDQIAEHIANTTLSANALVHLVGDEKVIIHQGSARTFANAEKVEAAITPLMGVNTSQEKVDIQEFFSNFADPVLVQNVLKKDIQTLQGHEKSLFVSLFPDNILTQAGMSKDAITAARREAHAFVYDAVTANVLDMAQNDVTKLTELGLSKREIKAIQELADEIDRGNFNAVRIAVDGADRTVVSAIRTAGLSEQLKRGEDGQKVWTEMVGKGASIREKLENGELAQRDPEESFVEKTRPSRQRQTDRREELAQDEEMRPLSAAEREIQRRSRQGDEPQEGIRLA